MPKEMKDLNKVVERNELSSRYWDQYDILDNFSHGRRLDNQIECVFYGIVQESARKIRPAT